MSALLANGCAHERPIHPMRLEGYPGAAYSGDFFPLRDGQRWVFSDRVEQDEKPLTLEMRRDEEDGGFRLVMFSGIEAEIRVEDGFVEIRYRGEIIERILKLEGRVGDQWRAGRARCMVFGFDRLDVLGETRRALVVGIDRRPQRDLYWFVPGMGIVRVRNERDGFLLRDARLTEYEPGTTN